MRLTHLVMNKKIIIQNIIIAALVSLVFTIASDFFFVRSESFSMRTEEWNKMDNMNYKDAMEYMNQHKVIVPPVRSFFDKYQDVELLKIKAKLFAFQFSGIFLGCLLLAALQLREKKDKNENCS